jgi:hypothetical protein
VAIQPHRGVESVRKKILIVGGKKEAVDHIKIALGSDFPVRFADPAQKIKAKRQIELIFFPCYFQCSLADCFLRFKFAHRYEDIPFAVVRFLPVDKRIHVSYINSRGRCKRKWGLSLLPRRFY